MNSYNFINEIQNDKIKSTLIKVETPIGSMATKLVTTAPTSLPTTKKP